jgi:glycosyltransferase involved in cell wall biosynthesis
MNDQVTVVIPTFNNAGGAIEMVELLSKHFPSFQLVVVDDGSRIHHWEQLKAHPSLPRLKKIRLAKNFGQHAALFAGMGYVQTEYMLTMDDDHQELVAQIPQLLDMASREHRAMIYGLFNVKRTNLRLFLTMGYRAISSLVGVDHGRGSGFRLMHKELFEPIRLSQGGLQFLDERIRWYTNDIGFVPLPVSIAPYQSRYSLRNLLNLSLGKAFYATDFPLRFMAALGGLMALVNLGVGTFFLYKKLIDKIEVPGFTSLIVSVLFSTGLLLFGLGILATYLRQILLRINQVPTFHIQEVSE